MFQKIKDRFYSFIVALLVITASCNLGGCTRISTGEVGLRVDASKQVQTTELMPGSWNQTLVGQVLTFPTKDISVKIDNKQPLTSESSALADLDMTIVYNLQPTAVAELYSAKSKSFHAFDEKEGDTLLMHNYIATLADNAAYKVIRQYKSLEVTDKRALIESEIRSTIHQRLKDEGLDSALTIQAIQVRNIQPNAAILASATEVVRVQNELKVKATQVELAELESKRMQALTANSKQSIEYMDAQTRQTIAQAMLQGKVQSIIVPSNMTGLMINK